MHSLFMRYSRALRLAAVAAALVTLALPASAQTRTLVVGSSATYPPFAYENPSK